MLEAPWRDDLQDPTRLIAGVPEGVPLLARLERQIAHIGVNDLVTEQGAHPPLDHEAVLVLTGVFVNRGR